MALNSGALDRRIQIRRATETVSEYGGIIREFSDFGPPLFARRRDVSDSERVMAGRWDNRLVTRFIVRASAFARSIERYDEIVHEGITFQIDGIKEVPEGRRAFIEVTAMSDEVA